MDNPTIIYFLLVKTVQEKLWTVCSTVQELFFKKKRVIITTPNEKAKTFIDELLWQMPIDSFLPHQMAPSTEPIVITTESHNCNQASILFNLCATPHPIKSQFEAIYELYDETSTDKLQNSQLRQQFYQENGFNVQTYHI